MIQTWCKELNSVGSKMLFFLLNSWLHLSLYVFGQLLGIKCQTTTVRGTVSLRTQVMLTHLQKARALFTGTSFGGCRAWRSFSSDKPATQGMTMFFRLSFSFSPADLLSYASLLI